MSNDNNLDKSTDVNVEETEVESTVSKQPIAAEVVGNTRVSVKNALPTEIDQFIAKYNFSLEGDNIVFSDDLKKRISNAEESFQDLKNSGKELDRFKKELDHYLRGMKDFNEENDKDEKKKGLILEKGSRILDKMSRMRYIGRFIGKVSEVPESFERNVTEELGEGGLTDLVKQGEEAINSVKGQINALRNSRNFMQDSVNAMSTDLDMVNKYLGNNSIDEFKKRKLQIIKSNLESNLQLSNGQLKVIDTGLNNYENELQKLYNELPGFFQTFNLVLPANGIAEVGQKMGDIGASIDNLKVESILSSFKVVAKSLENSARRKTRHQINEEIASGMLGYMKKIHESNLLIAQKRKEELTHNPDDGALAMLADMNEEYEEDQKLLN